MTNLNSTIEWTDTTWSPTVGCTKISPGCDHCYAETLTERFHGQGAFAKLTLHRDRIDAPLRWQKPRRVFVNSMSDLFHRDVPELFLVQVFAVMAVTPRHAFQILTKRHGRMRSLLNSVEFRGRVASAVPGQAGGLAWGELRDWPLTNVWLGVSVEDQKHAGLRVPALLDTPATVRFLSCEPLLSSLDLSTWLGGGTGVRRARTDNVTDSSGRPSISWVIIGGESGPRARPCDPDWIRSLIQQCHDAGIPAFVKQMGSVWARAHGAKGKGSNPESWPQDLRIRQFPVIEAVPAP